MDLLECNGKLFTATINNTKCSGEIIVKNKVAYLANNERGTHLHGGIKTNFKLIWIYNQNVRNLIIIDNKLAKERKKIGKEVYVFVEKIQCKTIMLFECTNGVVCVDPHDLEMFKSGMTFSTSIFTKWSDSPKEIYIPFKITNLEWIGKNFRVLSTGEIRTIKYISKDLIIDNLQNSITLKKLYENYEFLNHIPIGEKITKIDQV